MGIDQSLVEIVEKMSTLMGEFEDKALNSDELTDLTVKQIYYLDMINKLTKPTFSDLAEVMEVTKPTVTLAINKLINLGYVEKIQSSVDRRVYHIMLTKKGERIVQIHDRAHRDFALEISKCLEDDELTTLVELFKKIIAGI